MGRPWPLGHGAAAWGSGVRVRVQDGEGQKEHGKKDQGMSGQGDQANSHKKACREVSRPGRTDSPDRHGIWRESSKPVGYPGGEVLTLNESLELSIIEHFNHSACQKIID